MDLVIAEKDALARDIARALCGVADENARLPIEARGWAICACSGHLLELMEPAEVDPRYERTDESDLPIAFDPWPKAARSGSAAKRLDVIGRLLKECRGAIYHAGDADDEGQLIVDEVLEHFGMDPADPRVMRVYVNDSVDENIRRAFKEAKPNSECISAGKAALARSLADMCFGVSESRLAASRLHAKVSIGRVQTPTLGLVVARDRIREAHSKREHYKLTANVAAHGGMDFTYKPAEQDMPEDDKHVFDAALIEGYAETSKGKACAFDITHKDVADTPPLPYSMTTLVADLSKRENLTAEQVMDATQHLREDFGAITYNRSNTCYLKDAHFDEAPVTAPIAAGNIGCEWPVTFEHKSAAFDDAKLEGTPHHAIIPTAKEQDIAEMSKTQQIVYGAICMRYLVQFLPPAHFVEANAQFQVEGIPGAFTYRHRSIRDAGWRDHGPASWTKIGADEGTAPPEGHVDAMIENCTVSCSYTSPPPAFTDGSLVTAMSNVARYTSDAEVKRILLEKDKDDPNEHGSIGTTATRSRIIESLLERGYLERKGKAIVSTERGRALYDAVPEEIRGVDMTARWWLIQQRVAAGELSPDAVMRSVCTQFEAHRASAYEGKCIHPRAGICPRCGEPVIERGGTYSCMSNRSEKCEDGRWELIQGCGFKILPFSGRKLTLAQAGALLAGKKVALKGVISRKSGKAFDCSLALDAASDSGFKPIFPQTAKPAAKRTSKGRRRV